MMCVRESDRFILDYFYILYFKILVLFNLFKSNILRIICLFKKILYQ